MNIDMEAIGYIQSVFATPECGGRQPCIDGRLGQIIIYEKFMAGLEGLEAFSHIYALYYFHRQDDVTLQAQPCFDPTVKHGIFASRYSSRPNHIGMSILTVKEIRGNIIHCNDIDVVHGTPLLDIKPYVKQFDHMTNPVCGWYDHVDWDEVNKNKAC